MRSVKIIKYLGIFAVVLLVFFSKPKLVVAATKMCCPGGYSDGIFSCPFGVNLSQKCCKRYDFAQYNIVDKYPCDDQNPPKTLQCPPGYYDNALSCPFGVDLTKNCCKRDGFANYDIVPKVLSQSQPTSHFCNSSDSQNPTVNTALGCVPVKVGPFVSWLLTYVFGIAGGIAFLLMIYGFILLSTTGGDPKKMQGAQETVSSAITGLVVCIFAVFLLRLIAVNILRIPGIN